MSKKNLSGERGSAVMALVLILGLVWGGAFYLGSRGWGYSGYYGYHRGPSFFYWGGANTYHSPSVRSGSVGGPGHRGGGVGGGK